MYRLEMNDDLGRILSFPLKEEGIVTIGRNRDSDVVLTDKSVSRNHCLLHLAGKSIEIEDLGSSNGVIVGGDPIGHRTRLKPGDEIIIGENRLFLRFAAHPEQTRQTFHGPMPDGVKTH